VALASAACHPAAPPPDLSLDPGELLAQVERAQGRIRSVQGQARVGVEAPSGSGTVSQFLAAERPDHLHVEALSFFGDVLAVLTAADGRFALYDARAKVLYRGAATPENLARLVPLPLPAPDLVAILLGTAPLLEGAPVRAGPERGAVELVIEEGARAQLLRVGAGARVERSVRQLGGVRDPGGYELSFEDFRDGEQKVPFPRQVHLAASEAGVKLDVRWTEVEVNGALDPALFQLAPPRGARVVDLDGGVPPVSPFLPEAGPRGEGRE